MIRQPRYPIYVVSKGRHQWNRTARFLERDGTDFRLVVEPQEADAYAAKHGRDRLLVLPFSNLGLGSIPARNWIWEHAKAAGHERHWILDDNINSIYRRYRAERIRCDSGPAFAACEDFVERYENVPLAGLNYNMFSPRHNKMAPFYLNVHVYSCLLIQNDLPFRWRGRYNEDADLCLQVLSAGLCTILFNALLCDKEQTMVMKGGNTEALYAGDGRLKMAQALAAAWPGVVTVNRRFNRAQHYVRDSWKGFDTPLKLKEGIDLSAIPPVDEYGLRLVELQLVQSRALRKLLDLTGSELPVSRVDEGIGPGMDPTPKLGEGDPVL